MSATLISAKIESPDTAIISSSRIAINHVSTTNIYHATLGIAQDEQDHDITTMPQSSILDPRLRTDFCHMSIILMIALVALSAIAIGVAVARISPV